MQNIYIIYVNNKGSVCTDRSTVTEGVCDECLTESRYVFADRVPVEWLRVYCCHRTSLRLCSTFLLIHVTQGQCPGDVFCVLFSNISVS